MQALAGPAGRGPGEEVAIATGEAAPREDPLEVRPEEGPREPLERRPHVGVVGRVARHEAGLERAPGGEEVARGQAEGHEVPRPVEAVAEAGEGGRVPFGCEPSDKGGGPGPQRAERLLEGAAEQVDSAVGQARGQERDELTVGRVGIAEGKPDRVALDPRRVVTVAVEPLERFSEPEHRRRRARADPFRRAPVAPHPGHDSMVSR